MEFTKIHGLGNDFLYINCIEDKNKINKEEIPKLARYMCNRHFGVGADGLVVIEDSKKSDFKMSIYNTDGSEAEMCGNGIRGLGKYVYDYGLTTKTNLKIETLSGIKQLNLFLKKDKVEQVEVNMGEVSIDKNITMLKMNDGIPLKLTFTIDEQEYQGTCASIGNPHFIIFVKDVDEIDVEEVGKIIGNSKIFLNKANVEFVQILDSKTIKMRVWERGVGETFACGTGACCTTKIANLYGYVKEDVKVLLKGGELSIKIDKETNQTYMKGIVTQVFKGELNWIF